MHTTYITRHHPAYEPSVSISRDIQVFNQARQYHIRPRSTLTRPTSVCIVLLCLSLNHAYSSFVRAEESIVVTGMRRAADNAVLPYTARTINDVSIQQSFTRSLPDVLAQTPGVLVQKSANGQGSPFLRGFTGYRTLTMIDGCLLYTSPSPRDGLLSRMPSSA